MIGKRGASEHASPDCASRNERAGDCCAAGFQSDLCRLRLIRVDWASDERPLVPRFRTSWVDRSFDAKCQQETSPPIHVHRLDYRGSIVAPVLHDPGTSTSVMPLPHSSYSMRPRASSITMTMLCPSVARR